MQVTLMTATLLSILGLGLNDPRGASIPSYTKGEVKVNNAITHIGGDEMKWCTGFFVHLGLWKYMVTAAHCCQQYPILLSDLGGVHRVLKVDPSKDLCIASTFQGVEVLPLAQKDAVPGEPISMIGFPGDLRYDYQVGTCGSIESFPMMFDNAFYGVCPPPAGFPSPDGATCALWYNAVGVNLLVRGGNSGGPILNAAGEVVGIIVVTHGIDSGKGGMIPISDFYKFLDGEP